VTSDMCSLNPDASAFTPTFQNSAMGIEELEFDLGSSSEDVRILEITTSKMFFLSHDQRARARKPPVIKFVNRSDINQDPQTLKQYKEEDNIALPSPHSYDGKKDINVYSYENTVVIREPTNSRHERIEGNFSTNTDVSVVNLDNKECIKVPLLMKLKEILNLTKSVKVEVGDIAIAENKLAVHVSILRSDNYYDSDDGQEDSFDDDEEDYEENKGLVDSLTCLWRIDTSNPTCESLMFLTFIKFPGSKYAEDPKKIRHFSLNMNDKFICRTFRTKEELSQRDNMSLSFESNDEWENWCLEVFNVDRLDSGVIKVIQVGRGFEEYELFPSISTQLEPGKSNRFAIASHNNGLLPDENFAVIFNVESGERIFDMDFYYGGFLPLKKDVDDQIEFVNFCLGQIVFIRQKDKKKKRHEVKKFQYVLVSPETIRKANHVLGNKVEIDWDIDGFDDVQVVKKLHVDAYGLVVVTGVINTALGDDFHYDDLGFDDSDDSDDFGCGYVPYWSRKSESDTENSQHNRVYNCSFAVNSD